MCRICKGDHWTTRCPYKDTLVPLNEAENAEKAAEAAKEGGAAGAPGAPPGASKNTVAGKYVPPNMREGGNRRGESMMNSRRGGKCTRVSRET